MFESAARNISVAVLPCNGFGRSGVFVEEGWVSSVVEENGYDR